MSHINCSKKPSYQNSDGMLMFNVNGVCQGWGEGCCSEDCPIRVDPKVNRKEEQ